MHSVQHHRPLAVLGKAFLVECLLDWQLAHDWGPGVGMFDDVVKNKGRFVTQRHKLTTPHRGRHVLVHHERFLHTPIVSDA